MLADCFEYHASVVQAGKVVDFIENTLGLPKKLIKTIMQKGAVWVTKDQHTRRLRRVDKVLGYKDEIHLYYNKDVLDSLPKPARLIADENVYSIWFKPNGMMCQGTKWGDHCTINRWVEQNITPQRPAFIVHRLDRATSGLIIIAHQKKIASAFSKLFESRAIEKKYKALVEGHFVTNDQPLCLQNNIDGRSALTLVSLIKYDHKLNQSLLDVDIKTGRKHQIRRHLSEIGYPIIGDRLYGKSMGKDKVDLQLTAYYLSFKCPISDEIKKYEV